jgi:hypothetical protein
MANVDEQKKPWLTAERLAELLTLVDHADSIELKLTVPDSDIRSTISQLGMDPLDAQIRQVVFFDTPDLDLDRAGVVVRARRVQGANEDSVVKLRPVVPSDLPVKLRRQPEFGVEVDTMPGGFVCSGSYKRQIERPTVKAVLAGEQPIRKLFSKQQREFYATHAPAGIEIDQLTVLGPIFVLKLKYSPEGYSRRLVAEAWLYPDGSRILELSTKCRPGEGMRVALDTRAYLADRGVDLSGEQHTKTRTALEYFSRLAQSA